MPMKSKTEQIIGYPAPLSKASIEMLHDSKYYEQKERLKLAMLPRIKSNHTDGIRPLFKPLVPTVSIFSTPAPNRGTQRSTIMHYKNVKKKAKEKWLSKVIVENTHFNVQAYERKSPDVYQFNKGLLLGKPVKRGLILPRSRIKASKIKLTRESSVPPLSIFNKH